MFEAGCGPSPLPRPSGDELAPACLRGRKEVRRAAGSFPFSALLRALRSPCQCLGAGDGGTMSPRTAAVRQTCCCFNVRIATTALAIYHVVSVRADAGGCACVHVCVRARVCKRAPSYRPPATVGGPPPTTSPCDPGQISSLLWASVSPSAKLGRGPAAAAGVEQGWEKEPCSKRMELNDSRDSVSASVKWHKNSSHKVQMEQQPGEGCGRQECLQHCGLGLLPGYGVGPASSCGGPGPLAGRKVRLSPALLVGREGAGSSWLTAWHATALSPPKKT